MNDDLEISSLVDMVDYQKETEDLPDDWVCPTCGVSKDEFEKEE